MPAGRPTIYTKELAERICELVATHTIGIKALCKMYEDIPDQQTIKNWRHTNSEFFALYDKAKQFQAQLLVEECEELIPLELKTYLDDSGQERYDPVSATLLKEKIAHRRWMAARLASKVYGDRQTIEQTVTVKHEDALKELE
jgi:hypothetical protein